MSVDTADTDAGPAELQVADGGGDPRPAVSGPAHGPLAQLYQRQYGALCGYVRTLVGAGPPDPEDVAQEAFAKLAARPTLDDIQSLPAFLWRTAQNVLTSYRRTASGRRARDAEVDDVFSRPKTDDLDPERVLITKAELKAVVAQLREMTPRRRKILMLSRVHGLSNAEIARREGLARSTVSEHLARALLELDAVLHGDGVS
ncbi:MAG: sigma-70 family RNA polymerase sigma factor [Acidobacteriota bacterium]